MYFMITWAYHECIHTGMEPTLHMSNAKLWQNKRQCMSLGVRVCWVIFCYLEDYVTKLDGIMRYLDWLPPCIRICLVQESEVWWVGDFGHQSVNVCPDCWELAVRNQNNDAYNTFMMLTVFWCLKWCLNQKKKMPRYGHGFCIAIRSVLLTWLPKECCTFLYSVVNAQNINRTRTMTPRGSKMAHVTLVSASLIPQQRSMKNVRAVSPMRCVRIRTIWGCCWAALE